jgi:hypothetical protein
MSIFSPKMAISQGEMPPLLPKKHPFVPKSSCINTLLPLTIKKL